MNNTKGPQATAPYIVCLAPIDWDDVWEGPQEIMSRFAAKGWGVLFAETIGGRTPRFSRMDLRRVMVRLTKLMIRSGARVPVPPNVRVYTPLVLPPYRARMVQSINLLLLVGGLRRLLDPLELTSLIIWTYHPSSLVLQVCRELKASLLVYCCIHDFANLSGRHSRLAREEEQVVRAADLVFVLSRQLLREKRNHNRNVYLLSQGANLRDYIAALDCPTRQQNELDQLRHPLIGYIGTLHEWVDQDLLLFAAQAHPEWSFVLIGPERVDTQRLRSLSNVVCLGQKPHTALPEYVRRFDVGIIPYHKTGFGATIRPNKVLEYLIMGKPVVETGLPELEEFRPYTFQASSAEEFIKKLEQALREDSPTEEARRREVALDRSLDHTFWQLEQLVLASLESKRRVTQDRESSRVSRWKAYQEAWSPNDLLSSKIDDFTKIQWDYISAELAKTVAIYQEKLPAKGHVRLLDLGCGRGGFYPYLVQLRIDYVGVEPSLRQLAEVRENLRPRLIAGRAEQIPLPDTSLDIVVLKSVLDQCFDPPQVLRECRRVLRPGGFVLCSLPNKGSWYKLLFRKRAALAEADDTDHIFWFTVQAARELFERAQFEVQSVRSYGYVRLPRAISSVLIKLLGGAGIKWLNSICDALARPLLPEQGGTFSLVATLK